MAPRGTLSWRNKQLHGPFVGRCIIGVLRDVLQGVLQGARVPGGPASVEASLVFDGN